MKYIKITIVLVALVVAQTPNKTNPEKPNLRESFLLRRPSRPRRRRLRKTANRFGIGRVSGHPGMSHEHSPLLGKQEEREFRSHARRKILFWKSKIRVLAFHLKGWRRFRRRARDVGIRDLRERMRPFHGELDIESGSSGTKFRVAIPFRKMSSRRNLQPPRRFEPLTSWHLRRILCGS